MPKIMKKIYLFVFALTLLQFISFGQTNETKTAPTVIIQTVASANIGNITVNVNMTGFYNNVGSFQWTIKFDSTILQYQSTSNWASGISGVGLQQPTTGKLTMVWAEASPFLINGVLCTINFNYLGTPTCADVKFSDNPTAREITDATNVYSTVNYINGQVCQNTVGIEDMNTNNKINVFPNPSNGSFMVNLPVNGEESEIEIFNNIGAKVYEENISAGDDQVNLKLNLSSGLYIIKVINPKYSSKETIVIN